MALSPVQMWVDFEPFCYGVIQAHTKLSKVYLKKVLTYARSKGLDGGYPKLSWSVWRHMAINKMLLPERTAWAYFSAYYSIKESSREELLQDAELMQQSCESKEKDSYKSRLSVSTLEFVLHLFLQQSSKLSLRTSLVGDEWPRASPRSRSSSPDSMDSPKMSGLPSMLEENSRLSFILTNLTDLIELLSEPVRDGDGDQGKMDRRLSMDAINAFSYIIKASLPKSDIVIPLHAIATRHRFQNKSGYSRSRNDFSCRMFENWLRSSISTGPFSLSALLDSGTVLPWTMPVTGRKTHAKRSRIVCNGLNGHHNVILFLQCSDQTICQQSSFLKGSSIRLVKCNKSHFYLLSPLRSVSVEKCHNSLIVLGPVVKCVRVSACSNITLIVPSKSLIISSSNQVIAHVASPSRPLIIGENSSKFCSQGELQPAVTLAPYHTYYDLLEDHLAQIGLVISPQIDKWNNPMCMNHSLTRSREYSSNLGIPKGDHSDVAERERPMYRILPPSEFFNFIIPFQISEESSRSGTDHTCQIPWGLPEEYSRALKEKQLVVKKYKLAVRSAEMTKAERKKFQLHVEARFKEWLETTGNKRQLDDLVEIAKARDEASNVP